jgi:hypothetical protein
MPVLMVTVYHAAITVDGFEDAGASWGMLMAQCVLCDISWAAGW